MQGVTMMMDRKILIKSKQYAFLKSQLKRSYELKAYPTFTRKRKQTKFGWNSFVLTVLCWNTSAKPDSKSVNKANCLAQKLSFEFDSSSSLASILVLIYHRLRTLYLIVGVTKTLKISGFGKSKQKCEVETIALKVKKLPKVL